MLKSTTLFIGLLTEVSHLNPELSANDIKEVAANIATEPEFKGNTEIISFIQNDLAKSDTALLHCKKAAYQLGLRPEGRV